MRNKGIKIKETEDLPAVLNETKMGVYRRIYALFRLLSD